MYSIYYVSENIVKNKIKIRLTIFMNIFFLLLEFFNKIKYFLKIYIKNKILY